ncbi:DUF4314 domain-containing protein [Vibrio owensii]|uniref:DUF4314 domain-containing protein n=1 Tax=Vibrio owensii TaxID=696485 RepID=UPI0040678ED2
MNTDNLLTQKAALATYRQVITRYVFTKSKFDLLRAKSAVKWFNAALSLEGHPPLKTSKKGLFVMPVLADEKEARKHGYLNLWIKGTTIIHSLDVRDIKAMYRKGMEIRLLEMDDQYPVPVGQLGTIEHVDDMGTLHTIWEDGRHLGVCILDGDKIEVTKYAA